MRGINTFVFLSFHHGGGGGTQEGGWAGRKKRKIEQDPRVRGKKRLRIAMSAVLKLTSSASLKNIPAPKRERERHGEVEENSTSFPWKKIFKRAFT